MLREGPAVTGAREAHIFLWQITNSLIAMTEDFHPQDDGLDERNTCGFSIYRHGSKNHFV